MQTDEKKACCLLTYIDNIGPRTIAGMKMYAGSYCACLNTPPEEFLGIRGFGPSRAAALGKIQRDAGRLLEEYDEFCERGIRVFFIGDEDYPERLRLMDDAPPVLFARGGLPSDDKPSAAIIGARNCSRYGVYAAELFAGELAVKGVQIISGMAYGIDGSAARGALKRGCDSYAVLGSGVDVCYPKENYSLYCLMSGTGDCKEPRGGVISEYHPLSEALPGHFVSRNRIIAALGDVLLVIEAREKSGTSITVGYALEQGKDIFALPGHITDPLGRGCNRLLKEGAIPLTDPDDVLSYLGISSDSRRSPAGKDTASLSEDEMKVYRCLDYDAMHAENIAYAAGLKVNETLRILAALERKGLVENTAKVYYRKIP